jgi:hypothetical protein
MRAVTVIAAAGIGEAVGFYGIGGGQGTHQARSLTTRNDSPGTPAPCSG